MEQISFTFQEFVRQVPSDIPKFLKKIFDDQWKGKEVTWRATLVKIERPIYKCLVAPFPNATSFNVSWIESDRPYSQITSPIGSEIIISGSLDDFDPTSFMITVKGSQQPQLQPSYLSLHQIYQTCGPDVPGLLRVLETEFWNRINLSLVGTLTQEGNQSIFIPTSKITTNRILFDFPPDLLHHRSQLQSGQTAEFLVGHIPHQHPNEYKFAVVSVLQVFPSEFSGNPPQTQMQKSAPFPNQHNTQSHQYLANPQYSRGPSPYTVYTSVPSQSPSSFPAPSSQPPIPPYQPQSILTSYPQTITSAGGLPDQQIPPHMTQQNQTQPNPPSHPSNPSPGNFSTIQQYHQRSSIGGPSPYQPNAPPQMAANPPPHSTQPLSAASLQQGSHPGQQQSHQPSSSYPQPSSLPSHAQQNQSPYPNTFNTNQVTSPNTSAAPPGHQQPAFNPSNMHQQSPAARQPQMGMSPTPAQNMPPAQQDQPAQRIKRLTDLELETNGYLCPLTLKVIKHAAYIGNVKNKWYEKEDLVKFVSQNKMNPETFDICNETDIVDDPEHQKLIDEYFEAHPDQRK
ncbi:hypothetical protein BLNAU_17647 [Blattamonas nauphoetae]|uniref:Uncharacterized protein n=1 Tax=Blattamonas nauphoetae TaxID=2049346 RepID=A0ABQ9X6J7_9EUKA|nr:hypothetical protein BLNAU_17647 [Blattamonas nauphoetae]